jgi:hypothetical protein
MTGTDVSEALRWREVQQSAWDKAAVPAVVADGSCTSPGFRQPHFAICCPDPLQRRATGSRCRDEAHADERPQTKSEVDRMICPSPDYAGDKHGASQ